VNLGGDGRAAPDALADVAADVVGCTRCPRLVAWRNEAARRPPRRFAGQAYWARPVPGFGDAAARVLTVGLAPAAHGGNRTGRIFTGDRSGDFLFAALYATGFANQPRSVSRDDGLELRGMYIAAVNRCCPPANRPTPVERDRCLLFLQREIRALGSLRVIVCLGAFAWDGVLRAIAAIGQPTRPAPTFAHGARAIAGAFVLLGTYHPSQQNTFTGRLTPTMLEAVMRRARTEAGLPPAGA
jgi:uracil-DNA glycosylase